MDKASLATSTIDHAWSYLSQACQHGLRRRMTKTNPAADVQLPEARPAKKRKWGCQGLVDTLMLSRCCGSQEGVSVGETVEVPAGAPA